jgi:hypothetical protein
VSEQTYFEQFVGDAEIHTVYFVTCYGEISQFDNLKDAIAKKDSYRADCYPRLLVITND